MSVRRTVRAGEQIRVVSAPGHRPGIVRFEQNRIEHKALCVR